RRRAIHWGELDLETLAFTPSYMDTEPGRDPPTVLQVDGQIWYAFPEEPDMVELFQAPIHDGPGNLGPDPATGPCRWNDLVRDGVMGATDRDRVSGG
ncbi:MAG: hypothetical protein AAF317_19845, partial [Pseudomonadota bacterium]